MNGKFFDVQKEKQDRIINAALKVFAKSGYRHASTDDIVKEAAISKGLLFHYFESKLGVYTFVYEYSVRYITLELRSMVENNKKDYFEQLKLIEEARMHAMRGYPWMQQFLNRAMTEDVSEALLATEEMKNSLEETYRSIYEGADLSRIPVNVDREKLGKVMDYALRGLMAEHFGNDSFQPELVYREMCDYIDMMRKLVYRE